MCLDGTMYSTEYSPYWPMLITSRGQAEQPQWLLDPALPPEEGDN